MANGCHRMKNFMVNGGGVIKQKSPGTKCRAYFKKKAATYSPGVLSSTIGAEGLNFSVRNGKRWNPLAKTT